MAILTANGIILNFGAGTDRNVVFAEDRIEQLPSVIPGYNRNPTLCDPLAGGRAVVITPGSSTANMWRLFDINTGANLVDTYNIGAASITPIRVVELKNCYITLGRAVAKGGQQYLIITGLSFNDYPTPLPDGRAMVPANKTSAVRELIVNNDLTASFRTIATLSAGGFERFYYHSPTNACYAFGVGKTQALKLSIGNKNDLANYPDTASLIAGVLNRNGEAAVARMKAGSPLYLAPTAGSRFVELSFDAGGNPVYTEFGPVINESYTVMRYASNGRIYCFKGHDESSADGTQRGTLHPLLEINTANNVVRTLNNISKVGIAMNGIDGNLIFVNTMASALVNTTQAAIRYRVTESGLNNNNIDSSHELFYGFNVPLSGN